MKEGIKKHCLIIAIILMGVALRIGYSQVQLNPLINDNAKNAWEATRFLDNPGLKTLFNVPGHLELFSFALLFKVLGNNALAYNLLGIIQYIILSVFFSLVIKKVSGLKAALVASFLFAFSPPVFALNSVFWSGHSRSAMFTWIIFYLFCLLWEKTTVKRFLVLACLGGISLTTAQITQPIAIALATSLTLLFLKDRKSFARREFFVFLIVFTVSFLIFLYFNRAFDSWVYKSIGKREFFNLNLDFFKRFVHLLRVSFTIAGVNSTYQLKVGFQNELTKIIYGLIFSLPVPFWLFMNRKVIFKVPPQMLVFPLYLLVFFSVYALTRFSVATRYYLTVIPFYIYFLSDCLVKLTESNIKRIKILGFCAFFSIFSFSVANNLHFYPSAYKGIFELIRFAKQNNIRAIFTNYHMQFALVFYSHGTIAASSPFHPLINPGGELDATVRNAPSISYLFEGKVSSLFEECLKEKKVAYQQRNFDRLALYYGLSKRLVPDECP